MSPIARRLLGAAAAAITRKVLPDAVPDNPGTALALRPSDREIEVFSPIDRRPLAPPSNSFPTARPVQTLYVPPPAPLQPVAPAPPPRRRRKVVVETYHYEEREW